MLALADQEDLTNEFIIGGIIDKFFIQFELGWKVLKELLNYEGQSISASGSPKMILKTAFTIYDFIDENVWLEMLRARNALAARRLVDAVLQRYIPEFQKMKEGIESFYKDEINNL